MSLVLMVKVTIEQIVNTIVKCRIEVLKYVNKSVNCCFLMSKFDNFETISCFSNLFKSIQIKFIKAISSYEFLVKLYSDDLSKMMIHKEDILHSRFLSSVMNLTPGVLYA